MPTTVTFETHNHDLSCAKKATVCEGRYKDPFGTGEETCPVDEKKLLAAARSGEDDAFAALYRAQIGHIRGVGRAILGAYGDPDDLVQEVFLLAWKGLKTFRGDSTFRTWVTSIARHKCFSLLRQRKSQAYPPCVRGNEESPKTIEARIELARLVSGLTPSSRDLIELNLQGFTDQQIAKGLSLSIRAVRGRRQRAIDSMRKKLQERPEQTPSELSLMSDTQTSEETAPHMGPAASKKKRPLKSKVAASPVDPAAGAAEPFPAQPGAVYGSEVHRQNLTPGSDLFEQLVAETEQLEYLAAIEQRAQFEAEICRESYDRVISEVSRSLAAHNIDSSQEERVFCWLVKVICADPISREGCARLQRLRMGAHSRQLRLQYLDAAVQYFLPGIVEILLTEAGGHD